MFRSLDIGNDNNVSFANIKQFLLDDIDKLFPI